MGYIEIEEERILRAIEDETDPIERGNYQMAMKIGEFFKNEGLTPYYMYDSVRQKMFVSSYEAMERKFH